MRQHVSYLHDLDGKFVGLFHNIMRRLSPSKVYHYNNIIIETTKNISWVNFVNFMSYWQLVRCSTVDRLKCRQYCDYSP